MSDETTPVWKVIRVNDTSKLEGGEYVDYRDVIVRLFNGDNVHVLIPSKDYSSDTAAEQVAEQVYHIVNTLRLQSDVTIADVPKYAVAEGGTVTQLSTMGDGTD